MPSRIYIKKEELYKMGDFTMKNTAIAFLAILMIGFAFTPKNAKQTDDPAAKVRSDSINIHDTNKGQYHSPVGAPKTGQPVETSIINDDRLMAFYPFNGNANDVSGHGYDGTVSGAVLTNDRFNLPTSAYSFDGLNDSIGLPNDFQYPSMTLCAWIQPLYNNDSSKSIFMKYNLYSYFTFGYDPDGFIYACIYPDGPAPVYQWFIQSPAGSINTDKWVFTTVVINGDNDSVYLYINSELVAYESITPGGISEPVYISLGYSHDPYVDDFNGKIDEVRIYNDALSGMEVAELYDIGRRSSWIELNSEVTSNLNSISIVGETIAWAAGAGGTVVKTTDGGANWGIPVTPLGNTVNNIFAVSSARAYACVNPYPSDARIYRTYDGGNSWSMVHQVTGAGAFMNAVWMINENEGYAFGNPVGGSFILLETSDGGTSWFNLPSLPQYNGELGYPNNFTWRNKERGWFGTSSGRVYSTINGGNSWTYATTPLDRVFGVSFSTHSHGIIGNLTDDKTALTMDGGQTWMEVAPAGTGGALISAGVAVPQPQWWAVSVNKILHLSSADPVWSEVSTSLAVLRHISMKYIPDDDLIVGYAVGDSGVILKYVEFVPKTSISGMKFHDLNGNGVKGEGDPALADWTITLKSLDGMLFDTKNTDGAGTYSFMEVPAGEYKVGEVLKTDWLQTFPTGMGNHVLAISTGEQITGKNFGNIFGYRYIGPSTGNWSDSLNWTGNQPPGPTHAAIIPGDATVIVDSLPNDSILALRIQNGGRLAFNSDVGEIKVGGTVQIDAGGILQFYTGAGAPGIVCFGDFINRGTLLPGQSHITMEGDDPKLIAREGTNQTFYRLEIAGENTSLIGNMSILNNLILQKGINSRDEDTIFVGNPDTTAISGTGGIPRGTVKRSIASGLTGQYRFESPLSYLRFTGEGINPAAVSVTALPERTPMNLRWDNVGGIVNTVENTIRVDSVSKFSKWVFGIPRPAAASSVASGEKSFIDPVNRLYAIKADGGNGFKATVQLRYEQSEVPAGTDESQLQLFRGPVITDSVNEKWNMLSLPLIPDNSHKAYLFSEAVSDAFAYNGGYIVRDSLRFGEGFWLKFPTAVVKSILGEDRSSVVIPVNEGWNLVGSISYPIPAFSVASMPPGIIASEFFKYTTRYEVADSIKPMHGYWVKASGSGELVLSVEAGMMSKSEYVSFDPESMNKLIVMDGCGNEQSLYFGSNNKIDCHRYELPPVPPDGCFDVRYASGRMVEVNDEIKSKEIPVMISSVKYPIVISWRIVEPDEQSCLIIGSEVIMLNGSGERVVRDSTILIKLCLGSAQSEGIPKEFALDQNYPNPFNPYTMIRYQLPVDSKVTIKVYNVLGQVIQTLADEVQSAGNRTIEWNAGEYASGVYFYKLEAAGIEGTNRQFTQVRKLIIIK